MQADEMIRRCQRLLGDPHGDFHSSEVLLEHLNTSMLEIADRTRYLHVPAYLSVQEGQAWYTLPANFLSTDLVVYRGVRDPLSHTPFSQTLPWLYADTFSGTPQCFDIFGNGADERFVAQVYDYHNPLNTRNVLFNDWASIKSTYRKGDLIINIDNANAVAELINGDQSPDGVDFLPIDADFRNYTGGIPGRPYFLPKDTVRVISPNASLKSIILSPTPDTTDVQGQESLFLFMAARPRTITQEDIEFTNAELELDLELETVLQHLIMFYARLSEKSPEDPAVVAQQQLYETALFRVLPKIRRRIREWKSGYRQRFQRGWFRSQTIVDNTYGAGQDFVLSRIDI